MVAVTNLNSRRCTGRVVPFFLKSFAISILLFFATEPLGLATPASSNAQGEGDLIHHAHIITEWFGPLIGALAVLVFAVLFWNRQLRRAVAVRTVDLERANQSLHEHEDKLEEVQRMAKLGYWFWDIKKGDVEWSEEVYKIFKLDPSGFTPQIDSIMELSPWPDSNQRHQELIQRATENHETGNFEQRFLRPDKSIGYYFSTFRGVYAEDDELIAIRGTVQDITERKKAEHALLTAKEYAENLIETSNAIVIGLDTDGRITTFNQAAERITEYARSELENRNWFEVLVPKDRYPHVWSEFTRLMKGGLPQTFENPILTKSDKERYISWQNSEVRENGQIVGTISFGIDITDRKHAEEERERLLSAIEQAAEIIMITDMEGMIQYTNPAFERITQYTLDDVVGKHANILESDEHDKLLYTEMWQALTRGEKWTGRMISKKKDGTLFTEETTISPVFDFESKAVNYVAVKRDVTEEIQLEEQLRQSQKMEAIGQLTGGVAHDFNNMLQVIESGTDLVLKDLEPDHRSRGLLDEVVKAGRRAAVLVSQLLLFSRRKMMQPQIINMNDVVDDLIKMLRRIIGEDVRLDWEPDSGIKTIFADRSMVEQSLMNLCVNARDAMPAGGVLTIATHDTEVDEEDCKNHMWASPGQYVLMSVTDTGFGMDKETLGHIYEPFFTTKEVGKGTGLGLSTVYGIVRQHDGMIHVHSEPKTGTTFQLYWPVCERKKESLEIRIPDMVCGGSETLLIAEDDEMVRRLTERYLTKAGYKVITARNGAEAVARFKERSAEINMVILDVVMPEMGGRDAFEHMRALRPDLKALFASGYNDGALVAENTLGGGLELINKPFTRNQLLHAIRNVID